jgi:hypothetical protein
MSTQEELDEILREAESRGSLVDTHPMILERRRSPNSRKDHKQIVRAGGIYSEPPSHDWGTHGGSVSDPEYNEKHWGKLIKKGGV